MDSVPAMASLFTNVAIAGTATAAPSPPMTILRFTCAPGVREGWEGPVQRTYFGGGKIVNNFVRLIANAQASLMNPS